MKLLAIKNLQFLLLSTVITVLLIGCSSRESGKNQEEQKPNVLIILTDDMGYGDISCYNGSAVSTPHIDRLAEEGVRMTDFYVPTPYCAPSRATLITGRFPLRHQVIKNPTPDAGIDDVGITANEVTMGEVFQDAGYKTKLIGKWHLGHVPRYYPVRHGFDEYFGILYSNDMRPVQLIRNDGDTVEYPVDQRTLTQKYTNSALDFIEQQKDSSFFLMLNHAMPHKPLAASDDFYTPETKDDLYQDVIRELDWSVGAVIAKLAKLNILDNTIVVFMSDNGPWYGGSTGGLKGMKATTWEGGIRVPFMIRYPEALKPQVISVPCWSPDVMPTLLSLVGLEYNQGQKMDGEDITEVLNGRKTSHSPIFSMHGEKIITVRKGDYKLFLSKPKTNTKPGDWVDPRRPDGTTIIAQEEQARPEEYPGIVPEVPDNDIQLFNLETDPSESNDLSEQMPEKVSKLMKAYEEYLKTI